MATAIILTHALVTLGLLVTLLIGMKKMRPLKDQPCNAPERWPSLSVVIPTRNEERNVREALQSVLGLDYPGLEIVVVDDRSTDGTAVILAALGAEDSRVRIIRIDTLPQDWLGKNHALQIGAEATRGELLLFTDADVVFTRDALRRTVAYFSQHGLDHLAALGTIWSRSRLLDGFIGFIAFFGYSFIVYMRPWRVSNPKAKEALGVGAFNLLRRSVFDRIGGMRKVRLRPDDDLELGKLVKRLGFRQDCVNAMNVFSVEWYASLKECIQGLEKNMYAGFNYNFLAVILWGCATFFLQVLPFGMPFFAEGAWLTVSLATIFVLLYCAVAAARFQGQSAKLSILYPLWGLLFCYIIFRNPLKNIRDGGIYWRDTFYSLDKLKTPTS